MTIREKLGISVPTWSALLLVITATTATTIICIPETALLFAVACIATDALFGEKKKW